MQSILAVSLPIQKTPKLFSYDTKDSNALLIVNGIGCCAFVLYSAGTL